MFFFFLPYRVNRAFKDLPLATLVLIALNVIFYLGTAVDPESAAWVFGFRPDAWGLVTWLSSLFLHGGLFHVGWNMYFLWLFGSVVEDAVGRGRFLLIYLAGGLASCLVHGLMMSIFVPQAARLPLIGASGAVAALIGVFAVRFYQNKLSLAYFVWVLILVRWGTFELTSLAGVALYTLRELAYGLMAIGGAPTAVANWAHLGGLAFGAVVGLTFGFVRDADRDYLTDEPRAYARSGTSAVAAAKFGQLLSEDPQNPELLLERARAVLAGGGPAGTGGGEVVGGGGDAAPAHDLAKAISLLLKAGRKEEALAAYLELGGPAEAVFAEAAPMGATPGEAEAGGASPFPPSVLLALASYAESSRDYEAALRLYASIADRHPEARDTEKEKALFRLAHVYLAMGMSPEAMRAWQAFAAAHPTSDWLAFADRTFVETESETESESGAPSAGAAADAPPAGHPTP